MTLASLYRGRSPNMIWLISLSVIAGMALGGLAVLTGSFAAYGLFVLAVVGGMALMVQPAWGLAVFMFAGRQRVPLLSEYLPEWAYAAVPILLCVMVGTAAFHHRSRGVRLTGFDKLALGTATGIGVWMLVTLAWSPSSDYAATKMFEYGGLTLIGFLLAMRLGAGTRERQHFFLAVLGLSLGLALIALVTNRATLLEQSANSLSALGGGRNTFARLTSLGALVSISWVVGTRRLAVRAGTVVATLVLVVSTLFSGSRGSTIAFLFALAAATMLMLRSGRSMRIAGVAVVTAVLCVIAFVFLNSDLPAIQRFSLLLEGGGTSVMTRLDWINSALQLVQSRPFTGHGLGAFAPLVVGVDQIEYPHNIFIELLLETGIVGTTLFLGFLGSIVGAALKGLKQADNDMRMQLLLVFACFVFSVVAAQFSGDLYDSRHIWIFGGAVLACVRSTSMELCRREAEAEVSL